MKKLIIVLFLLTTSTAYAYCTTDYKCFSDCLAQGYMYGYCKQACTWCQ